MTRKVITVIMIVIFSLVGCTKDQISKPVLLAPTVTQTPTNPMNLFITLPPIGPQSSETPNPTSQKIIKTPVELTIDPTYLNFPTYTPTPTVNPEEFLVRIVAPGPMSKVISPIDLIIHISPENTGLTRIELMGEDGSTLFVKVFKTYSNLGYYTRIEQKIDYEIRGAAEIARLQISTFDSFGLLQAYNSVRLLLQAVGDNQFTRIDNLKDRVLLRFPSNGESIEGGVLEVQGDFQPVNDLPVIFELIGLDGTILGSRVVQFSPVDGAYQQFGTTIPYQLQQKTPARLIIRQSDDRIDGLAYLFSRKILLEP